VEINELIGPNGNDLLNNPLEVSVRIQEKSVEQFASALQDAGTGFTRYWSNFWEDSAFNVESMEDKNFGERMLANIPVVGQIASASKASTETAKQNSEIVALGIQTLNNGQQQLDVIDQITKEKKAELEQSLKLAQSEQTRLYILEDIEKLERNASRARDQVLENNDKILKQVIAGREAMGDGEFNKVMKEVAAARYEGTGFESLAKDASDALAVFGKTDEEIAFRVSLQSAFAGGDMEFTTVQTLLDAAGAAVKLRGEHEVVLKDLVNVIAKTSKIGVDVIDTESTTGYKNLDGRIKGTVYGQDDAVDKIVEAILVSKSGLREPNKPIGSFLFVGPTGTGKTETARSLSNELQAKLVKFDMSEYQERHSVAKLIGAPPGYVGHAEDRKSVV
jgi:ATP-dependent Clp protease ATP-binding subunit ClpA